MAPEGITNFTTLREKLITLPPSIDQAHQVSVKSRENNLSSTVMKHDHKYYVWLQFLHTCKYLIISSVSLSLERSRMYYL